jgi:hypothetical protein
MQEARKWLPAMRPIENAYRWRQAGFSLEEAQKWSDIPADSPMSARRWIQLGYSYYEALMWKKASIPLDVALPWKLAGYESDDARDWRSVVGDNIDKANKWKTAGFAAEETRLWILETNDDINRALQLKKEGVQITLVTRHEDYSLVDSYRINKQCPEGVESPDAFFRATAKETVGICYEYSGRAVQQIGKTQGVFSSGEGKGGSSHAVVIDFEKFPIPEKQYRGVIKGYKTYEYASAPNQVASIPLVKAIVIKQVKQ